MSDSGCRPMTPDEAFRELGTNPEANLDTVRRSYLRLLKTRKPESDPAGFMRLREAYELARKLLAAGEVTAAEDASCPAPTEALDSSNLAPSSSHSQELDAPHEVRRPHPDFDREDF